MHRSNYSLTPKLWTALDLVRQFLELGEQAVVFSSFRDPLDRLASRLHEAGVLAQVMDGRSAPAVRAQLSARFQRREVPLLLCGMDSCAEGHSWPQCRYVILLAYSWAADKVKQSLDRIYRINSTRDVHVYVILCENSVDLRLAELDNEKADSSELVLDGELVLEPCQELNLLDLLEGVSRDYDPEAATVDEASLEARWPALREALRSPTAGTAWGEQDEG